MDSCLTVFSYKCLIARLDPVFASLLVVRIFNAANCICHCLRIYLTVDPGAESIIRTSALGDFGIGEHAFSVTLLLARTRSVVPVGSPLSLMLKKLSEVKIHIQASQGCKSKVT